MKERANNAFDTIVAISTPLGEGGIGVVRISGPRAQDILTRIFEFKPKQRIETHRQYLGIIKDPQRGRRIDEAVASFMKSPHSYTGEDVVELSGHGGPAVLNQVVSVALSQGARLAERGEFTKRAFLNGKLDLAQAEAVIDLIRARTREGADAAADQLFGSLSGKIKAARNDIISILTELEAAIDFPDDFPPAAKNGSLDRIRIIRKELTALLETADAGRILREGARMVILGKPNVGKSSLLNALLRADRAIVSHEPGTTRDTIEESANIKGMPIVVIDTAGLRRPDTDVERMGVERARRAAGEADVALIVLDASEALNAEDAEAAREASGARAMLVMNKTDKGQKIADAEALALYPGAPLYKVSALKGQGIEQLEAGIFGAVSLTPKTEGRTIVTNTRHKDCLIRAEQALLRAEETAQKGLSEPFIAIDLKDAAGCLGEITGERVSEEVIDRIFSDFCVGK